MGLRPRAPRGYTVIELMITVAVVGILAAAAISYLGGFKKRVGLQSMMHDLDGMMGEARLRAIENGRDNAVLFFPPTGARQGRIVLYEDGSNAFFGAGAPNFGSMNPANPTAGAGSQVVDTIDMPPSTTVATTGLAALPAPLAAVVVNVGCGFCGADRGAVVFDQRGRARFYSGSGPGALVAAPSGAAISFVDSQSNARWIMVITASGAVQLINRG